MNYGIKKCNGCRYLIIENWPHGAGAARCMSPAMGGRTIEYSGLNRFANIFAPANCREGETDVDKEKRET